MTKRSDSDTAFWALEIERDGRRPEYISAEAIEADGDNVTVYTSEGHEVSFKRSRVRKILLMRTVAAATA